MQLSQRVSALRNKEVFISCVVPVYNEEAVIESFINELQPVLRELSNRVEIIIVDDGSRDHTLEKIRHFPFDYHVKVLGLSRNFGKEVALTAGLEHSSGEVVITLDADFQHPVEVLPLFLQQWSQGYDMVYGMGKNREAESWVKRNLTCFFYWIMKKITNIDVPENAGDFRLMDGKIIAALKQFPERTRFMKGLYAWVGYKTIGVPFEVKERAAGQSSWGFMRLTELAITGITSFSDVPLRVWGLTGFVISLVSLIYAIYIITVTLIYGADLPGFPTLVVAIMFFGGIQLLSIGILGEYIARIFTEVKQRPQNIYCNAKWALMNKLTRLFNFYLPLFLQISRFGIVGLIAAGIHFTTVVLLVQSFSFAPLLANLFGFSLGFQMSYWGHRLWTFQETVVLHRVTYSKLLLVQIVNFSANELLFYIFLSLHLPYPLALLIVLAILPVFTFVSSKWWVFKS